MRPHLPRQDRRRTAGFSLLELIIAITLFTIVIGAVSTSMARGFALAEATQDKIRATEACTEAMARVIGEEFGEAFARFNLNPADDPLAPGTAPGGGFAVRGLEAIDMDIDGLAGEIQFPGDGTSLREDAVDPELGMPRDLNGDGAIDNLDHSGDYILLPVRARISWQGVGGDNQIELVTTVVSM
jgi:prepilin-type N-terminal cleavage/methylation domain-containing protein